MFIQMQRTVIFDENIVYGTVALTRFELPNLDQTVERISNLLYGAKIERSKSSSPHVLLFIAYDNKVTKAAFVRNLFLQAKLRFLIGTWWSKSLYILT
jgi:hypothetical protein